MTFEGVKKSLVEEKKLLTNKELKKYCVNLFLFSLTFGGTLAFSIACILSPALAVIFTVGMGLGFIWILDYSVENEDFLKFTRKISKLWFLGLILFVAVYMVLVYFKFY